MGKTQTSIFIFTLVILSISLFSFANQAHAQFDAGSLGLPCDSGIAPPDGCFSGLVCEGGVCVSEEVDSFKISSISASPSHGEPPLDVEIKVTIKDFTLDPGEVLNATYRLDCTSDGTWEQVIEVLRSVVTFPEKCKYSLNGNYTALVQVSQGGNTVSRPVFIQVRYIDDPTLFPLTITPGFHNFGNVNIGTSSRFTFTVKHKYGSNKGTIGDSLIANPPFYCRDCFFNLGEGDSKNIIVVFEPTVAGNFSDEPTSTRNGGGLAVRGVGVAPAGASSTSGGIIQIKNPLKTDSLADLINTLIDFIFTISIAVAPVIILYGGFLFVTAAGRPEQITKARNILLWTAIGFVVILLSRGLITILKNLLEV